MTDVLSAAAGAALLATPAVTLPAALRVPGRAPFVVAALVAAAASVVAVFIALSLADLLTRGWILLGQFGVAGASRAAWHLVGRPAPPRGYVAAERRHAPGLDDGGDRHRPVRSGGSVARTPRAGRGRLQRCAAARLRPP